MILEILEGEMRDGGGWKTQDLSHFFNTQEIQRGKKKKNPLPFNVSGAEVLGLCFCFGFFFFLFVCFVLFFKSVFSEIFLKLYIL